MTVKSMEYYQKCGLEIKLIQKQCNFYDQNLDVEEVQEETESVDVKYLEFEIVEEGINEKEIINRINQDIS